MKKPRISLIAAMAMNRVIGINNRLPWHIPEDLKRFRALTRGNPVIMGRKTYESIGRALPERKNIVISRSAQFRPLDAVVTSELDEAFEIAIETCVQSGRYEIFVIGGAQIYELALSRADRLYLTLIDQEIEGDAWFPSWSDHDFREIERVDHTGPIPFSFRVFERVT